MIAVGSVVGVVVVFLTNIVLPKTGFSRCCSSIMSWTYLVFLPVWVEVNFLWDRGL